MNLPIVLYNGGQPPPPKRRRTLESRVTVRRVGGSQDPEAFPDTEMEVPVIIMSENGRTVELVDGRTGMRYDPNKNEFILNNVVIENKPNTILALKNVMKRLREYYKTARSYVRGENEYLRGIAERSKARHKISANSAVSKKYTNKITRLTKRRLAFRQRMNRKTITPSERARLQETYDKIESDIKNTIREEVNRIKSIHGPRLIGQVNYTSKNALNGIMRRLRNMARRPIESKTSSLKPTVPTAAGVATAEQRRSMANSKLERNLKSILNVSSLAPKASTKQALTRWVKRTGVQLPQSESNIKQYMNMIKNGFIDNSYGLRDPGSY